MRQTLCCCPSSIYTEIATPFLDVLQFLMTFIRPLELTIPDPGIDALTIYTRTMIYGDDVPIVDSGTLW
jgi:hypothetical protein